MVWTPPTEEAEYYNLTCPADQLSTLSQLLVPFLGPGADPTFGRAALPRSPDELKIRSEYKSRDGTIPTDGEVGKEWVAYQAWERKDGIDDRGAPGAPSSRWLLQETDPIRGAKWGYRTGADESTNPSGDILVIHGLNDYGGRFSSHVRKFLDDGYRLIVPDLPGHGRSTGVHACVPSMDKLTEAMYGVVADVRRHDSLATAVSSAEKRNLFIVGQSLGGCVAIYTCLRFGSRADTDLTLKEELRPELGITGGIFLCPLVIMSPDMRRSYPVEMLVRGIAVVAGPLPLVAANRGKNSHDPDVEVQFLADPQTYHGKARAETAMNVLNALVELQGLLTNLKVPFSLHHGTGDRVVSYRGSEKLYKEASSTDKKLHLYEGQEHILLRVGHDELDDRPRQTILNDIHAWLRDH